MGKTRQWINIEGDQGARSMSLWDEDQLRPAQEIQYKGELVLFRQCMTNDRNNSWSYVIVPGYRASELFWTKEGCSAIKVEIIPDEEKAEIKALLSKYTQGPINFWD